ncbi:acyltransferase family protein [Chitinophaga sp. 30R24]|uniref:acyltransferase family protein n=1 Tax=Chitinophaga sp. 30R24 TaxID=3248838 RepID=UPI003B8F5295
MKINSIQFLRAIAILLVLYAYAIDVQMAFSVSHQQKFHYLPNFGAIGIDLLFVITGFITCYTTNVYTGKRDGWLFLKKRFLRINPLYYTATTIYIVAFCLIDKVYPVTALLNNLKETLLIIPILNSQQELAHALITGWPLSFIWWFYLLFYALILLKVKNKILALLLIIPALVLGGYFLHAKDFRLQFYLNPIMLEFLFGVIIYWLYRHVKITAPVAGLLLLLGLAGYLYNILHGYGDISETGIQISPEKHLKRTFLWGLPCAFVLAGSIFLEQKALLQRLWNNRFFLLLGNTSFAIYLVFYTVFYLLSALYIKTGFFWNPDLSIFVHMALGIGAGLLFYKYAERPFLQNIHFKPLVQPAHVAMP